MFVEDTPRDTCLAGFGIFGMGKDLLPESIIWPDDTVVGAGDGIGELTALGASAIPALG